MQLSDELNPFRAFGRQRHQQKTQVNQVRAKAKEAAVIRLAIGNVNQKALRGLMSKSRRRDGEAVKLINKFSPDGFWALSREQNWP
jgi:hypothetical protein